MHTVSLRVMACDPAFQRHTFPIAHGLTIKHRMSLGDGAGRCTGGGLAKLHVDDALPRCLHVMSKAAYGDGVKWFNLSNHRAVLGAKETSCKTTPLPPSEAMAQRLKLKIQLYCGDEIAMGPGKADLLSAIAQHGSISAAARTMDMSYRRAWLLTDAMNRCWSEPLVETSPGSAKGGGAKVTPFGDAVLGHYRRLQERLQGTSDCDDYAALAVALLPTPKGRQKG